MKRFLPKLLAVVLSIALIFYLASLYLPTFLEKQALKPPPPYKKLENVQGVATSSESGKQKLILMGTIGTDKNTYAKNPQPDLSPEVRKQWALERDRYIQNHLSQAKFLGVPAIDVFDASLDSSGNVKSYLVRDDDNIHPSPKGILFISKKIADILVQNKLIK